MRLLNNQAEPIENRKRRKKEKKENPPDILSVLICKKLIAITNSISLFFTCLFVLISLTIVVPFFKIFRNIPQ